MLTVRATGSIADAIRSVRDVPARIVPYAAAAALTRTAHIARADTIPAAMRAVFNNPRDYTLNSLFVRGANAKDLSARIQVKNQAGSGVVPENFLLPEVVGGQRKTKRFENALRLIGAMKSGERAMPAAGIPESQYESGAFIRRVVRGVEADKAATGRGKRIFAGAIGRKKTRGVWEASGAGRTRKLRPLLIFTTRLPTYRRRLDFEAIAQRTAEKHFPEQFQRALSEQLAKGRA